MAVIYVVEDDASIRELMLYTLRRAGYTPEGFADAAQFREAFRLETARAVLLDIMLPGESGLQILSWLRQEQACRKLPVLLLTALDSEHDTVRGLDLGADDYITKPVGMMELLARLRAALRRVEEDGQSGLLSYGTICLDEQRHQATVDGVPIALTAKEYALLRCLMQRGGAVLSREELLQRVWGVQGDLELETRTVDVHIRTLRRKLGTAGAYIETVRGVGYRMGMPQ